jgi:hypothetical protein
VGAEAAEAAYEVVDQAGGLAARKSE